MNITFEHLNKVQFPEIARQLFDILANNMTVIAPTGNTREEDYVCWLGGVGDGLKREERQLVLIKDENKLIGFFQYYTNADTFMMEEIQLVPEYQGKGVFRKLYGFMLENIRLDLEFVEAYANIHNSKSIAILEKMGLINIGLNKNGNSYHFKGEFSGVVKWCEKG